ncbi:MAG: hypothetical protein ABR530_05240 [Pyrinomonadaceae bacterium]
MNELLWKIDLWLLEFEGEIDAHFGAGDVDRGMAAYRAWHENVAKSIAHVDRNLAHSFARTAQNAETKLQNRSALTPRTIFMRTCGGKSKRFLNDIKRKAMNGTLKVGSGAA